MNEDNGEFFQKKEKYFDYAQSKRTVADTTRLEPRVEWGI